MPGDTTFKLRDLGFLGRLGVFFVLMVFAIGMASSAAYIWFKYHNRDEQPALTLTDVKGVYHGVKAPPAFKKALERGHPETLKAGDRELLLKWLNSGRIMEDYESIDLGDASPREIITASCISCHSRAAATTQPEASRMPLESKEDLKAMAFEKELFPNDVKVLTASTHAHALALASMTVCLGLLILMTTWRRGLMEFCWFVLGIALLADISSWWIARSFESAVYVIIAAGGVYNSSVGLVIIGLTIELLRPRRIRPAASSGTN